MYGAAKPETGQGAHADPWRQKKMSTMGQSQLDHAAIVEGSLVWWIQECFEERRNKFEALTSNSPDFSPIELWYVLGKQVWSIETPPSNLQVFIDLLLTACWKIPQHPFRGPVKSMPRWVMMHDHIVLADHVHTIRCFFQSTCAFILPLYIYKKFPLESGICGLFLEDKWNSQARNIFVFTCNTLHLPRSLPAYHTHTDCITVVNAGKWSRKWPFYNIPFSSLEVFTDRNQNTERFWK